MERKNRLYLEKKAVSARHQSGSNLGVDIQILLFLSCGLWYTAGEFFYLQK